MTMVPTITMKHNHGRSTGNKLIGDEKRVMINGEKKLTSSSVVPREISI
jgi:hypothetical protein